MEERKCSSDWIFVTDMLIFSSVVEGMSATTDGHLKSQHCMFRLEFCMKFIGLSD